MKKTVAFLILGAVLVVLSSAAARIMKSAGPPSCSAGEPPGNNTCATSGCHDDSAVNTGTAQVSLDLGAAAQGYTPGSTYTVTIAVSKSGMTRAGFQFIHLQDNLISTSPGSITLTDNARTQVLDKNHPHGHTCPNEEKTWVEHTFDGISTTAPGFNSWSFKWKAPATDVGTISFYLAALESDNDQTEAGDRVYTVKKTISAVVGLKPSNSTPLFHIFPNPAASSIFINCPESMQQDEMQVLVTDPAGKQLLLLPFSNKIQLTALEPGIYLVSIRSVNGDVLAMQKMILGW